MDRSTIFAFGFILFVGFGIDRVATGVGQTNVWGRIFELAATAIVSTIRAHTG